MCRITYTVYNACGHTLTTSVDYCGESDGNGNCHHPSGPIQARVTDPGLCAPCRNAQTHSASTRKRTHFDEVRGGYHDVSESPFVHRASRHAPELAPQGWNMAPAARYRDEEDYYRQ